MRAGSNQSADYMEDSVGVAVGVVVHVPVASVVAFLFVVAVVLAFVVVVAAFDFGPDVPAPMTMAEKELERMLEVPPAL